MSTRGMRKRSVQEVAEALVACRGVIQAAADRLGISRETVYQYLNENPVLQEARRVGEEVFKDHARSVLVEAVEVDRDPHIALKVLERRDRANWGRSVAVTTEEKPHPPWYCIQRVYTSPDRNEDPNDPTRYGPRYLMPWATPEQRRKFEEDGRRLEQAKRKWADDHSHARRTATDVEPED